MSSYFVTGKRAIELLTFLDYGQGIRHRLRGDGVVGHIVGHAVIVGDESTDVDVEVGVVIDDMLFNFQITKADGHTSN